MRRIDSRDLEHVLDLASRDFAALRGSRLLVTGATGFVGSWIIETVAFANVAAQAGIKIFALVPPGIDAERDASHITGLEGVHLVHGDILTIDRAELTRQNADAASLDAVIHAAIAVNASSIERNPLPTLDTAVEGTRRILDLARHSGARRFLFLSSGAVYGPAPSHLATIPETHLGGPDSTDPRAVYAEGKRIGEMMCACDTRAHGLETVMARGFAFVGPRLPIDRHFAVGNFIRDALAGGPVVVSSDGTAVRSYQYAADMAIWLWALLMRGQSGRAYNVGASREISIRELASAVAHAAGNGCGVEVRRERTPGAAPERYVPDVRLASETLQLRETIPLEEAIARTIRWHRGVQ